MNIKIDGENYSSDGNETVLKALQKAGKSVPTLCNYEKLEPFTSCFVCLVEVKGAKGFVPACSTKVCEGMEIESNNEVIRKARKAALELLVSDHTGDCEPPCVTACPSQVPIREFLALAAEGQFVKAAQKIREKMPFPGSLGRVCPRFCETKCRRHGVDDAVSICFMKRFVSDEEMKAGGPFLPEPGKQTGKKVAIIGAGPGGLTAAYYLRLAGHAVTIFEKQSSLGGMLKYGIPDYRLPPDILEKECRAILSLGVDVKFNTDVGKDLKFETIRAEYDSVFISIGAQKASDMPIEGSVSKGVLSGIELLDELAKGKRPNIGKKVAVIGGGNTAMDAARSSLRLDAEVVILYRRTEKEMPANRFEIEEAKHEGVKFEFLVAPIKISEENGKVQLECIKMGLGTPDASGRRRPVPVSGSEFVVEVDTCITAIGQAVDPYLADNTSLALTKWGTFVTHHHTLATNIEGVFAGGDCAIGADVAVRAIDAGRRAAYSIDQYLNGEVVTGEPIKFNSSMGDLGKLPSEMFENFERKSVLSMPVLDPLERIRSFVEVEQGFPQKEAVDEARRCIKCGCVEADDCKLRDYCSEYGVDQKKFIGSRRSYENDNSHAGVVLESGKCINCGICVRLLESNHDEAIGFVNRGFEARVKPPFGKKLGETTTNLSNLQEAADACPTAGLVRKSKYRNKGVGIPS